MALVTFVGLSTTARADVVINATNFPDANFRSALTTCTFYTGADGKSGANPTTMFGSDGTLTNAELAQITGIIIQNSNLGIVNLTGIEYFTNLVRLEVCDQPLDVIDLSHNAKLKEIYLKCYSSNGVLYGHEGTITSLDLSNLADLENAYVRLQALENLNVSACTKLKSLDVCYNQLNSLSFSGLSSLTHLYCDSNPLSSISLSGCPALTYFHCAGNSSLQSFDLSSCTELDSLYLGYNYGLTSLDLSHNPKLKFLDLEEDSFLESLNLSNNKGLLELNCYKCSNLNSLDLSNSNISRLDVASCGNLSLNTTGCSNLTYIHATHTQLGSLDVSEATGLQTLYLGNTGLTALDISTNSLIQTLECAGNNLGSLDVTHQTNLKRLICYDCGLTSLDISQNTLLEELNCYGNQLKELDLSANTELKSLICLRNKLTSLDLSACMDKLLDVWCSENELTMLDLSGNTTIRSYVMANLYGYIGASQSPKVTGIRLDGKLYAKVQDEIVANNITNMRYTNLSDETVNIASPTVIPGGWLLLNETGDSIKSAYYRYQTGHDSDLLYVSNLTLDHIENAFYIDAAHFPDANFRTFLLTQKYGIDGLLTQTELAGITAMDVENWDITDLTGIQYFTALEILNCSRNNLTQLNVSALTQLEDLNCWENSLTTIDVSTLTKLTMLGLEDNNLTSLDVSALTQLRDLAVSNNQLTSIDVTHNTALRGLLCDGNQLQTLDLSANTLLTSLYCQDNALTAISLPSNSGLRYFSCYKNQLTGDAMAALVAALPTLSSARNLRIYYDDATNEGNEITSVQVKQLAQKGWTAKHYDGSAWVDYAGLPLSYDLWLSGQQVTSTNCDDLTALAGVSGTVVSFDELTQTLTLSDATITKPNGLVNNVVGLESNIDGLTIKLVGTNTVNISDSTAIVLRKNTTIQGTGKLTATSGSNGIYIYDGTLTVTGGATVNADASSATASTKTGFGIYGRTTMKINPRTGATTTIYLASLVVEGCNTKVQAIGSMVSLGALNTLTCPEGSTLKIVDPSTLREVNGYFNNHNVCTRSDSGLSGYTYTPATGLVRIITPTIQQGDVNEDGEVNTLDISDLADMLVGNKTMTDSADVDGNGSTTLRDLPTLVNMLLP